jgi:hypothetical protein
MESGRSFERMGAVAAVGILLLTGCTSTTAGQKVTSGVKATSLPEPSVTRDVATKASAEPAPKSVPYAGRGDKILRLSIGDQPVALVITHVGSSNFAVEPEDASGETQGSIVNTIGNYRGTVLTNTGELGAGAVTALKITADGRWTVTVTPLGLLRQWNGAAPIQGKGDDVFRVTDIKGSDAIHITHKGESNFAVQPYGGDFSGASVVNEIGNYDGEVQFETDTVLVAVTADGVWTMTKT